MLKPLLKAAHEKLPLPPGTELLDLGVFMFGISEVEAFKEKIDHEDFSRFKDKTVQIRGCAPTWAYMIASHQLVGIAKKVEFRLGDGKTVLIW